MIDKVKKRTLVVLVLILLVLPIFVSAQDDCTWLCQLKNWFMAGENLKGEALKGGNCA